MKNLSLPRILVASSICSFFLCLTFPGFYVGLEREPYSSLNLLSTGWLGPLNGHFSWFASPLYLLALIKYTNKPNTSGILSLLALLLALSFLVYDEIIKNANGGTTSIRGVGWGYFLWVNSFLCLLFASSIKSRSPSTIDKTVMLSTMPIALATFIYHFYMIDESVNSIESGRFAVFENLCSISREIIHIEVEGNINGIYFDSYGGRSFGGISNGKYSNRGSGSFAASIVSFVEKDSYLPKHEGYKYIREKYPPPITTILTNDLQSEYRVSTISLTENIPKEYGVISERIEIHNRITGKLVAETTYAVTKNKRDFFGKDWDGQYSTILFVLRSLNLIEPSYNKSSSGRLRRPLLEALNVFRF